MEVTSNLPLSPIDEELLPESSKAAAGTLLLIKNDKLLGPCFFIVSAMVSLLLVFSANFSPLSCYVIHDSELDVGHKRLGVVVKSLDHNLFAI